MVAALVGLGVLCASGQAFAQGDVEIRATTPPQPKKFEIVPPSQATREATRPREADFYPPGGLDDVRVRHQPAFIEPFVGRTEDGNEYGLSGWTAPSPPVGSLVSRKPWAGSGDFALGISFTWDAPPPPGKRPAPR